MDEATLYSDVGALKQQMIDVNTRCDDLVTELKAANPALTWAEEQRQAESARTLQLRSLRDRALQLALVPCTSLLSVSVTLLVQHLHG